MIKGRVPGHRNEPLNPCVFRLVILELKAERGGKMVSAFSPPTARMYWEYNKNKMEKVIKLLGHIDTSGNLFRVILKCLMQENHMYSLPQILSFKTLIIKCYCYSLLVQFTKIFNLFFFFLCCDIACI